MSILDIFRIGKFKREIQQLTQENNFLKNIKLTPSQMELSEVIYKTKQYEEKITLLNEKIKQKSQILSNIKNEEASVKNNVRELKSEIITLEDDILMQTFGFYKPKYNLTSSEAYSNMLSTLRAEQKEMVKTKSAVEFTQWTVNGSVREGKKMTGDMIRLVIRAFNSECDSIINKVKFNNISTIEQRLRKSHEDLNKLGNRTQVRISTEYLNAKIEELYLSYEYELKKQEEKEEQNRIKEEMREKAKVEKEIAIAKAKLEKEETHYNNAINEIKNRLEKASEDEKVEYEIKLKELEAELEEIEKDKEDVYNRERSQKAGYVYIISNIGSFGENVYKIGMTRRLEPMDRVKELGDASVPFTFDVHAMIFSESASDLETSLHRHFSNRKVNKINGRKEFFRVTLDEIEECVRNNHDATVEFTKLAEASQYRMSLAMEKTSEIY